MRESLPSLGKEASCIIDFDDAQLVKSSSERIRARSSRLRPNHWLGADACFQPSANASE